MSREPNIEIAELEHVPALAPPQPTTTTMFANLTAEDKEAFFALLDEYFESRPHLLGVNSHDLAAAAAPAAAAIHRTVANNPQAAANLVSSGAKTFNKWNSTANSSPSNVDASSEPLPDDRPKPGMGKVAAAAANLSAKGLSRFGTNSAATPPPPPLSRSSATSVPSASAPPAPVAATRPSAAPLAPPPPHRTTSSTSTSDSASRGAPSGLVSTRGIGDVKTTSVGSVFGSVLPKKHFGGPPPPPPTIPTGLARPKNDFAPPPKRTIAPTKAPTPPPEPEAEPEEDDNGEWAKALYDFTSTDPGDLPLKEKQHVRVIEHTSDDWWTGEANGKRGLFPSAYVEIINV